MQPAITGEEFIPAIARDDELHMLPCELGNSIGGEKRDVGERLPVMAKEFCDLFVVEMP